MPGPSAGPSGQPGPSPMQHPAGLRTPQMAPNAPPQGQQPLQQQQGQNQQQRGAKRNSTSPGQEVSESSVSSHRASQTGPTSQPEQLPRNESSPPDRKRPRRSPGGEQVQQQQQQQQPPMTPIYPHPPQQPGAPPMQPPHMQTNGLMRGGMPMAPFPGPPMTGMGNPMMGHPLGTPQMSPMNPAMNPAMMGGPPPGGTMSSAQMHQVGPLDTAFCLCHSPKHSVMCSIVNRCRAYTNHHTCSSSKCIPAALLLHPHRAHKDKVTALINNARACSTCLGDRRQATAWARTSRWAACSRRRLLLLTRSNLGQPRRRTPQTDRRQTDT